MSKFNYLFFDLDGTLIDSVTDIAYALNQMRHYFSLADISPHAVSNIVGKGFPTTVRKVLELDLDATQVEQYASKALSLTLDAYEKNLGKHTTIYAGVTDVLQFAQVKGIKMAVVTNKEVKHATKTLKALKLIDYFNLVVGGDSTQHYKPHPAPLRYAMEVLKADKDTSLMIGDSDNDYLCAQKCNIPCILTTEGYNQGVDFTSLKPYAIINQFIELKDYL